MIWTNEKPTTPGYYWFREESCDAPVMMRLRESFLSFPMRFSEDAQEWDYEYVNGQFAGPIPEPMEP